jgi:Zn-dependent protease
MKYSWRIGRIFGIDFYVDSSWFVILILFTWILATSYFPSQLPNWPPLRLWIFGLLTSVIVFASVLAHELAHSLVAIKHGVTVKSITLFILGGVAQISSEPREPLQEFVMAVVGPLTSFILSAFFFLGSLVGLFVSPALVAIMSYLALINLVLGLFNLLPGFPMDGGRVLRALVWKATGDLKKATKIASVSGQVFAFVLMGLGIFQVLMGGLSGLWLVFVGWFLHSAAVRSYQQVRVETRLKGVSAGELMNENFKTIPSDLTVAQLVDDYIFKRKERVFVVTDEGQLQGIVCLEDVKATPRSEWPRTTAGNIMTPRVELKSVTPETSGEDVLKSLAEKDVHQVPVMIGDRVAGLIRRSDVLRYIKLRDDLGS